MCGNSGLFAQVIRGCLSGSDGTGEIICSLVIIVSGIGARSLIVIVCFDCVIFVTIGCVGCDLFLEGVVGVVIVDVGIVLGIGVVFIFVGGCVSGGCCDWCCDVYIRSLGQTGEGRDRKSSVGEEVFDFVRGEEELRGREEAGVVVGVIVVVQTGKIGITGIVITS
jgi:hypothetical protein